MQLFLQLTVLINIVIFLTEAQQPVPSPPVLQSTPAATRVPAPPQVLSPQQPPQPPPPSIPPALVQTTPNIIIANNNLITNSVTPPQPSSLAEITSPQPTKPTVTQPTRTTLSQDLPTTTSFFPSTPPIFTIDVSQPPSPVLTTQTATSPETTPHQPAQQSTKPTQAAQQETTRPIVTIEQAHNSSSTTSSRNNNEAISTFATTPMQTISPTSSPTRQPQFIPSTRVQEPRLLVDNNMQPQPNAALVVQASPSTPPSSVTVQFLKPKTKFKCTQPSHCLNGAMCFNGTCFCPPGYTGESCAVNIDECRQVEEPCSNNGVCIDEVNQFRCECAAGFKGDRCQEFVDMCINSPCLNGAQCVNHRIDYTCQCEPGWEGRHCEKNIDECLKNPCQNNGTCYDLVNDYRCDCGSSGFTGKNCDVDFDDCGPRPCAAGAKECVDLTGDFKCICYEGFTGKRCEIDIDECQTNPCENNGTCKEKSFNFNRSHNQTADLAIYQYPGYTCECKEEYYGDRCEERKKCYTKTVFELCNNQQAECVNVGSSYECLINASFDGSGQSYATYKVLGEFKMREIYVKYRSLSGGIIMSFETTQPDSPTADLQLKKTGLYLSGLPIKRDENIKFDELLDGSEREIRLALDTPTEIKSITLTRQNNINDDHSPFKGCLMQVRLNNQLVPLVDYGFGLNNTFQMDENHLEVGQCRTCFEKDCLNRGHCEFQEGYDHCNCPETFTGNFCEIDVNECEKNYALCLNGGTCENLHGGHRCNCKEGYRGEKCQEISDYCKAKLPCVTGTCKNVNPSQGIFQCECPSSHIGKRCERKRDCLNECHNQHAKCVNNVTCACLPGRREDRIMCEYVSSCEQVEGELCLNGGTCKNLEGGGYHCICEKPFYGPICQLLIEKPRFDVILLIVVTCVGFLMVACAVVSLVIFRSVRKARATRGTYSPSTQEKFGNSASDLLKPPQPERLI